MAPGFLGSHLCRALLDRGWDVVARRQPARPARSRTSTDSLARDRLRVRRARRERRHPVERVASTRCCTSPAPASPRSTSPTRSRRSRSVRIGTQHALELARKHDGARFLLASTSEIYGDPEVHPAAGGYWGNVNPSGRAACTTKRSASPKRLTMAYHRTYGVDTKIVRIFNTYGPPSASGRRARRLQLPRAGDRRAIAHRLRRRYRRRGPSASSTIEVAWHPRAARLRRMRAR